MKEIILRDLKEMQKDLAKVLKSVENGEFISPQGALYAIGHEIPFLINKLKRLSPNI